MKNRDAEQARILAAREWHKAIDTIPDPVAIIAPDYSIEKANRAYAEFVGADDAALPGMKCFNLVHGCDSPPSNCPLSKTLTDHQAHRTEFYEPHISISAPLRYSTITAHLTGPCMLSMTSTS